MASTNLKVESGIQLLTRLTKKSSIERFYPILFENGPKHGEFIEIFSEGSVTGLLVDIIYQALTLNDFGGQEANVIIFNTDGKITVDCLINFAKSKFNNYDKTAISKQDNYSIDILMKSLLKNLFIIDIYDITQFYASIQNLENILMRNSNICLIVFDSLTAFYWDEQSFKVTKMDLYIKKLIRVIQRVVKDYKVTIVYTRPQYFSSSKESIEKLEPCCEIASLEQINYRIQIVFKKNKIHQVNVRTHNKQFQKKIKLDNYKITWL